MGKGRPKKKPEPAKEEPKIYEIFDDTDEEKDIDAVEELPVQGTLE